MTKLFALSVLACVLFTQLAHGCDIIVHVKSNTNTPFQAQVVAPNGQKSEKFVFTNQRQRETYQNKQAAECAIKEWQVTVFDSNGTQKATEKIFQLSYFWCYEMASEKFVQFQMVRSNDSTLSSKTIVDQKNFFRDICVNYFIKNPIKIGGPERRVQIDEAFVTKRKYNRGRLVNEAVMIFGGIEEETGECFVWPVEKRDADTLLTLIQCYILPGTTIVSDCWRAYGRIASLSEGYHHLTVKHSVNFVDPDTGAHTNLIEQLWQKFKRRHKHEFGTARTVFEGYVSDFCWRQRFKGPDVFFHFWSQIASCYPIK